MSEQNEVPAEDEVVAAAEVPKQFVSREAFVAAGKQKPRIVEVFSQYLGGWVRMRGMTAKERDEYEGGFVKKVGKKMETDYSNMRARLLVKCILNPDNDGRMFGDKDANTLGALWGGAVDELFEHAQELSGLRKEDIEELEKNLESDPADS